MTSQGKRIALLLSAAGLLAAGLARCVGSDRSLPVHTPADVTGAAEPVDAGGAALAVPPDSARAVLVADAAAAEADVNTRPDAGLADAAAPVADAQPGRNPVGALLHSTTPADRALLADVERIGKRTPPPEVGELIKLQHGGASRAELERFIDRSFGKDVALRTTTLRWLEEVAPTGKPTTPASPAMTSKNPPHIQKPTPK
jgi:hypothetical protein